MNAVGSGEPFKNELERVRAKLLGTSRFDTEAEEFGNKSPELKKNVNRCCPLGGQKLEKKTGVSLNEIEQNTDLSGADTNGHLHKGERDSGDCETAMAHQVTADVCQAVHEPDVYRKSASCNIGSQAESSPTISSEFYFENSSKEIPHTGCAAKRGNSKYPLTTVEVSVSGLQQCAQFVSRLTEGKTTVTDNAKNKQGDADSGHNKLPRRNELGSARPSHNLSKAPISMITLKTANNGLCSCQEMLFNKGSREDRPTKPFLETEEKETSDSADLSAITYPKTHLQTESGAETKPRRILQDDGISEGTVFKEKSPAMRRRLSKTIQHLQEKLQQELEYNESKSWKEDDRPGKVSEPKRASKPNNRFVRERSRRRSKSRVGYKILQSARKYPHACTKERPYRQWMGVGNCVGNDRRYIVSSNSSQAKKCLLVRENSPRKGDGESSHNPGATMAPEDKISRKDLEAQLESNKTEKHDLDAVPNPWPTAIATNPCDDGARSNRPGSIRRERPRGARRLSLYPDRRIRPPTPHSDFSCRKESTKNTTLDSLKQQTANGKSLISGVLSTKTRARWVSNTKQTPHELGTHDPCLSDEISPTKSEFDDMVRTSKRFTAAPRQQRKLTRATHLREDNIDAFQNQMASVEAHSSSCDGNLAVLADTTHHGSIETLWSDVSTTTGESSTRTESSSSWYCKEISRNHDKTIRNPWHSLSSPEERTIARVFEARQKDRAVYNRKYVDVQAVVDFKGSLPGQLSFQKGQTIRQLLSSSQGSTVDMSYGYYRTGALRRKRKGLFPSACVTPLPPQK